MQSRVLLLAALMLAAVGCSEARRASELHGASPETNSTRQPKSVPPEAGGAAGSRPPIISVPEVSPNPAPSPPRNGLPPGSCPAIACAVGMQVILNDISRSFEYLRSLRYEFCRNDHCLSGGVNADTGAPPNDRGSGVAFSLPAEHSSLGPGDVWVEVSIINNGDGSYYMMVNWTPWNVQLLKDGDHYSIHVTDPAGRTGVLLDVRAVYKDTSIREPCYLECKQSNIERRASGFPEPGDEDAGSS